MTQWLTDTLLWTGVLIAAVLVLRRPAARLFGPQVAYALWALPLVRLLLPPLVLPASMAPTVAEPVAAGDPLMVVAMDGPVAQSAAASLPWADLLLAVWLVGALVFIGWRIRQYRAMRRDLLAAARPVGQAGTVRLVETPAVSSPVAFGIVDKVVALPPLFMAQGDVTARDLAIAHELAHHRGHDLPANMAAQAVLALHWFNPVAWAGWRAMRRDQEAACDARVMAGCARQQKAAYARVIAGFATGRSHLALAAPMACPVLGEKSIIHRLRTLSLAEPSAARRQQGLAAIIGGALAVLPLTASISYAQDEEAALPAVPDAAEPGQVRTFRLERREGETGVDAVEAPQPGERRIIIRRGGPGAGTDAAPAPDGADQAEIDRMLAEIDRMEQGLAQADGAGDAQLAALGCHGSAVVQQRQDANGRRVMVICRQGASEEAMQGLRDAQAAILDAEGLSVEQRERIIGELQQEIDRLEAAQVSFLPGLEVPQVPAGPQVPAVHAMRVEVKVHFDDSGLPGVTLVPVRLTAYTFVPKASSQQS